MEEGKIKCDTPCMPSRARRFPVRQQGSLSVPGGLSQSKHIPPEGIVATATATAVRSSTPRLACNLAMHCFWTHVLWEVVKQSRLVIHVMLLALRGSSGSMQPASFSVSFNALVWTSLFCFGLRFFFFFASIWQQHCKT